MQAVKYFQAEPKAGEGIYTKKDVADILHLPYGRVSNWFEEVWGDYTFGIEGNKAIYFYTLIEFYTFYILFDENFPDKLV